MTIKEIFGSKEPQIGHMFFQVWRRYITRLYPILHDPNVTILCDSIAKAWENHADDELDEHIFCQIIAEDVKLAEESKPKNCYKRKYNYF